MSDVFKNYTSRDLKKAINTHPRETPTVSMFCVHMLSLFCPCPRGLQTSKRKWQLEVLAFHVLFKLKLRSSSCLFAKWHRKGRPTMFQRHSGSKYKHSLSHKLRKLLFGRDTIPYLHLNYLRVE